ncbi:MAG: hypothetical protein Q8N98_03570, partial [bacterium]|nr:hypothetical protein [bacterium]
MGLTSVSLSPHFFPKSVRNAPESVCGMPRNHCAEYPGITVRYGADFAGTQPHTKYGDKVIVRKMDARYLKESTTEKNIRTDIYQTKLLNKEFALPLNVVIILKTNLDTQAQAHVILFSTDLELAYDKLIKFYSLRFQIEFN